MSLEIAAPPVLEPERPTPEIPPMSEAPFKSEFLNTMQRAIKRFGGFYQVFVLTLRDKMRPQDGGGRAGSEQQVLLLHSFLELLRPLEILVGVRFKEPVEPVNGVTELRHLRGSLPST